MTPLDAKFDAQNLTTKGLESNEIREALARVGALKNDPEIK